MLHTVYKELQSTEQVEEDNQVAGDSCMLWVGRTAVAVETCLLEDFDEE